MAQTIYVEMRDGEEWHDVTGAFLQWCYQQEEINSVGCHEGNAGGPDNGRRYAAISIPDHSISLLHHLRNWAAIEQRDIG